MSSRFGWLSRQWPAGDASLLRASMGRRDGLTALSRPLVRQGLAKEGEEAVRGLFVEFSHAGGLIKGCPDAAFGQGAKPAFQRA